MISLDFSPSLSPQSADRIPEFLEKISARNQGFWGEGIFSQEELLRQIENFSAGAREQFDFFVLLGIGGSSLGPIALREALASRETRKKFFVADNIDPDFLADIESEIVLEKTLFLTISKSGGTVESLSQFFHFSEKITKKGLSLRDHFVFVGGGYLEKLARDLGSEIFPIPENVGGRFSVLSAVGLLPAALMGISPRALLEGAKKMRDSFLNTNFDQNIPFQLAVSQFFSGKNSTVFYSYSHRLFRLADWNRQLLAESTGKKNSEGKNVGFTPIAALGATDQHSQNQLFFEGPDDKFFCFFRVGKFAEETQISSQFPEKFSELGHRHFGELLNLEMAGTLGALQNLGRPCAVLHFPEISAENLGAAFFLFEGATAFLGEFLEIDAFDQPGVELSKVITKELLTRNK